MKVTLNPDEILQAALVGVKRNINAIGRGNFQVNKPDQNKLWQSHIEGAMGEMAVAKVANKFWSTGTKDDSDIGEWEVRTTHANGILVIRQRDVDKGKANKTFILVRGSYGNYDVVGWIKGVDAIKDEYWRDPTNTGRPKAWFFPTNKLNSFKS